jgi:Na+/proline symporter
MNNVLAPYGGAWLLVGFILAFLVFNLCLSAVFAKNMNATKSQFIVANRDLNLWQASLSIGASYLWAPAFFITATLGYTKGWQGVLYFLAGNGIALCVFGLMVNRICQRWPNGFTITDFFRRQYSQRVQFLYWMCVIGLIIGAFATQIFAGAKFLHLLSGIDFTIASILLAVVPLCYSLLFGFRSSVINGLSKMILCLTVAMFLAALTVDAVGWTAIVKGMSSVTQDHGQLFSEQSWHLFATFGLVTMVGLLSGPFGDQSMWQRAFATADSQDRKKSFMWSAILFLITPICMSVIGFAAAGTGFVVNDTGFVNVEFIVTYFGVGVVMLFAAMVLAGITMDSHLSAVSSVAGHDFARYIWKEPTDRQSIMLGRASMIMLAVIAVVVANIPNITLIHLFLIYNNLRASTIVPTLVFMITQKPLDEAGVFWGILISILVAFPVLVYGVFTNSAWAILAGPLLAIGISGAISIGTTAWGRRHGKTYELLVK